MSTKQQKQVSSGAEWKTNCEPLLYCSRLSPCFRTAIYARWTRLCRLFLEN